jgi:hypothetical protein
MRGTQVRTRPFCIDELLICGARTAWRDGFLRPLNTQLGQGRSSDHQYHKPIALARIGRLPAMMDNMAFAQDFSSARRKKGMSPTGVDERLSRLGVTFASLDAALLAGDTSPSLYDRWWTVVRDALPIQARAARGRRIKATMLLAVIRQTCADGPACDLARSIANDLTARSGKKRRPRSYTNVKIRYFVEKGLSRRAAKVLTALGCESADDVLGFEPGEFRVRQNCGRVTCAELSAFAQERRRLRDER